MDTSENEETVKHLWNIGQLLSDSCPEASKYYMFRLKNWLISDPTLESKEIKCNKFCNHCGSLWTPDNYRIRINPVPTKNRHIAKLLKWEEQEPWKLSNQQKKKLKQFKEATSKVIYKCFSCQKSSEFPGIKRKARRNNRTSLYTLPPNMKQKKSDLNAGLFISGPLFHGKDKIIEEKQEDLNSNSIMENFTSDEIAACNKRKSTSTLQYSLLSSSNNHKSSMKTKTMPISQCTSNQTTISKKKKKSLMAAILKEEENAQKKTSLSSFLVSFSNQ